MRICITESLCCSPETNIVNHLCFNKRQNKKKNCCHLLNIKETEKWRKSFGESCCASRPPTRPPCRPVTEGLMSGAAGGFPPQLRPPSACWALYPWSQSISSTALCSPLIIHISLMGKVSFRENVNLVQTHTTSKWQSWALSRRICKQPVHVCKLAAQLDPLLWLGYVDDPRELLLFKNWEINWVGLRGWCSLWVGHGGSGYQVFPRSAHCVRLRLLPGPGGLDFWFCGPQGQLLTLRRMLSSVWLHLILVLLWLFSAEWTCLRSDGWASWDEILVLQPLFPHSPLQFSQLVIYTDLLPPQKQGPVRMFLMQWSLEMALIKERTCEPGRGEAMSPWKLLFKYEVQGSPSRSDAFALGPSFKSCPRALRTAL